MSWVRRAPWIAAALAVVVVVPSGLRAQAPAAGPDAEHAAAAVQRAGPRNHLTLDATALGGSIAYARRTSPGRYLGFGLGLGGDFLSAVVLGGAHFAEEWALSYEPKDAAGNELLFEVLHAVVFRRHELSPRWQTDYGLRGAVFLHGDDSDDDLGAGWFGGGYAALLWGGRHVRVGPRVMAGVFREERTAEFGVLVNPVVLRLTLPW